MKSIKFLVLLSLFSYSFASFSKTIIVSDIDDTIKKANSMGGIGGVWHFLKKKPYEETRDLFNEIKKDENDHGEATAYYYVSAAPSFTFDGDEWIRKNNFPIGPVILKTKDNGGETYAYKYRTIKALLQKEMMEDHAPKIIFFGDNSQHDAKVYYDLNNEMNLNAEIYIRDVSTEGTFFSSTLPVVRLPGEKYFFSERELIEDPFFAFMSPKLQNLITTQYEKQDLIPGYTLDTLGDRLKAICEGKSIIVSEEVQKSCKAEGKTQALKYWAEYYHRY